MFPLLFQSAPHPANLSYAHLQQIIFKVIMLNFHPYFFKEKKIRVQDISKDMGQV